MKINQEIDGISKGARLSFEKVFLYNNRDILGFFEGDFCSQLYIKSNDAIIVGMNKDAPVNFLDMYFLKKIFFEISTALSNFPAPKTPVFFISNAISAIRIL